VKIEERGGEGKGEGGRKRGCDEGMWTYCHLFIRLSGPPVVTETVPFDSLMSIGGRRAVSCEVESWNSS
jgi:hypothetical protein